MSRAATAQALLLISCLVGWQCTASAHVWAIVPFEAETLVAITPDTIKQRTDCHFRVSLSRGDVDWLDSLRILPMNSGGEFLYTRAAVEGSPRGALFVGKCGEVQWGRDEGWLAEADFLRLKRILYARARASAGCYAAAGSDPERPLEPGCVAARARAALAPPP